MLKPLQLVFRFCNFAFVLAILYEYQVLLAFILFQRSVDPNQLDQKRMIYHRIERFIEAFWNYQYIFYFVVTLGTYGITIFQTYTFTSSGKIDEIIADLNLIFWTLIITSILVWLFL